MTITLPSRKTIRTKMAALIQASMVGTGKPLVAVYAYQKARLKGITPCMVLVSEPITPSEISQTPYEVLRLGAHAFCMYDYIGTGSEDNPQWTEEESEDAMDEIAVQFRQLCKLYADRDDELNPEWINLVVGSSEIDGYTDLEGQEFRHEYFPLTFFCLATG